MSLLGFQRALADLAASPDLCRNAIGSPRAALEAYELTDRERARLTKMVCDPLMATNCVLYRVNRVTPIYMFFPMSCRLLGPDLRPELDAFWSSRRAVDLQYLQETDRFTQFVKRRLEQGALRNAYLAEVLDYEVAVMQLRFAHGSTEPLTRYVRFSHEPARLLSLLQNSQEIPEDLRLGEYLVLLDARGENLKVQLMATSDLPV